MLELLSFVHDKFLKSKRENKISRREIDESGLDPFIQKSNQGFLQEEIWGPKFAVPLKCYENPRGIVS